MKLKAKKTNKNNNLSRRLRELDPTAAVTYFPAEGKYLAFTNTNLRTNTDLEGPPKILTGNFHECKKEALMEAIKIIESGGSATPNYFKQTLK